MSANLSLNPSIYYIQPEKPSWTWSTYGPRKIAAFDFDHTLVEQASGAKFPKDADDWKLLFDKKLMKEKFEQLDKDGYLILIITNQGGVEKKKVTVDVMQQRIKNFTAAFEDVPIYTFAAIKYDHCRKPCTGVWDYITGTWSKDDIDVKNSFYVGDAAGRVKGWDPTNKKRKDFSCSDRKFAHNAGVDFFTPEQFFLGATSTKDWEWGGIDPEYEFKTRSELKNPDIRIAKTPEMIILVGCAASGKSSLCEQFPNHIRINMDTLKTKSKCIKTAKEAVGRGQSVIIDNTNPDPATRKIYTDIAKANTLVPHHVRCIHVNCPKPLALHLNQLRVQSTRGETLPIPTIAYNIYFKKFVKPSTTEEDIDEFIEFGWIPNFKDERHKKLFLMRY